MRKLQAAGLVTTLAAALVLGACGSDENDTLDSQTAAQIGGALAAQITGVPASFTATDVSAGSGVGGGFFAPRALATARWASGAHPNLSNGACTPSVDDATDNDGDGVPDDATFTFSVANCTTGSFHIEGTIHLVDPSTTAVGYAGSFNNLLLYLTGTGSDFASIELDGSHSVLGTPATGTLSENLVTSLDARNGSQTLEGSLSNNWTIQFDATAGNIVMDTPLPDGDFDINGSFEYDVNGQRFNLSVRTEANLEYDSSCIDIHPFSAGELRAHVGGPNGNVFIKITYLGCGQEPDVEFFGNNS